METCAREGKGVACASLRLAETFMRSCRRPTEAAHFREQKCANNRQLIVCGIQRFLRHACTAHIRMVLTRITQCALCISVADPDLDPWNPYHFPGSGSALKNSWIQIQLKPLKT